MTIPSEPITYKKLIIVKQLYENAVVQSASRHSVISRLLSVIGFDLAIETVLRAAVGSLDSSKSPADGFQSLVQQCDSLLDKTGHNVVPDKANIQHVHSIRNDAQHKAKYPNESDVSDCRTYTRDFLQKIVAELWGLNFEQISLTDVIQHAKVKQYLVDAETALSQDKYQDAIQSASAGLTWTLNRVKSAIVGSAHGIPLKDLLGERMPDSRILEKMQDTLLYVALGMNYTEYMQYKKVVGAVIFAADGNPHFHGKTEPPEQSNAEFVVSYSIKTVLQIEGIVGSIDEPFGSKHW